MENTKSIYHFIEVLNTDNAISVDRRRYFKLKRHGFILVAIFVRLGSERNSLYFRLVSVFFCVCVWFVNLFFGFFLLS